MHIEYKWYSSTGRGNPTLLYLCSNGRTYFPAQLAEMSGVSEPTVRSRVSRYGVSHKCVLAGPARNGCKVGGDKKRVGRGNSQNRGTKEWCALGSKLRMLAPLPPNGSWEQRHYKRRPAGSGSVQDYLAVSE